MFPIKNGYGSYDSDAMNSMTRFQTNSTKDRAKAVSKKDQYEAGSWLELCE